MALSRASARRDGAMRGRRERARRRAPDPRGPAQPVPVHGDDARRRGARDHPLPAGQDPGQLLRRLRPGGDLGRLRRTCSARATGCASCTATSAPTSSAASPRTATSPTTWAASGGLTGGKDGNMHFGDRELGCVGMVSMLPDMALVASGMALAFKLRGERARGDDLLRRGLDRERPVARGDELRRHPRPAGRLHAREQQFAYSTPNELEFAVDPVERAAHLRVPRASRSTATTSRRCSRPRARPPSAPAAATARP